jgi:lipopolysaccharide transport system permease protein
MARTGAAVAATQSVELRSVRAPTRQPSPPRRSGLHYLAGIWSARHFWTHLALADLRNRWRRSYLGAVWSILQPLGITALIAFVLGRLFKLDILDYAPYIFSGIVAWDFIAGTALSGALAFVQNEPYIKQYRHPLAIYTLRTALANILISVLASIGLIGWILVMRPSTFGWSWLSIPLCFPLLMLTGWGLATILAYLTTRFRDIPHALGLILQALWFVSPVYFEPRFFRGAGLSRLIDDNPLYHLLQTLRAPLLAGEWPTLENYAWCVATIVVLFLLAWLIGRRFERNVIFYL